MLKKYGGNMNNYRSSTYGSSIDDVYYDWLSQHDPDIAERWSTWANFRYCSN